MRGTRRSDDDLEEAFETLGEILAERGQEVGRALGIGDRWLNAGPAGLIDLGLPDGLVGRVTVRRYGSLEIHLQAREDLICFTAFLGDEDARLRDEATDWCVRNWRYVSSSSPTATYASSTKTVSSSPSSPSTRPRTTNPSNDPDNLPRLSGMSRDTRPGCLATHQNALGASRTPTF